VLTYGRLTAVEFGELVQLRGKVGLVLAELNFVIMAISWTKLGATI
jgi:hypothetical protein